MKWYRCWHLANGIIVPSISGKQRISRIFIEAEDKDTVLKILYELFAYNRDTVTKYWLIDEYQSLDSATFWARRSHESVDIYLKKKHILVIRRIKK